ncbi:Com family DNA-binding transcriptional regulator [Azorhizobium caulinodans]|uniref:Com family DNA-binding transcriptional regulator n=1 Tax=Azorhizobium caulinodans TaxID=7 RepID=UPI0039E9096D
MEKVRCRCCGALQFRAAAGAICGAIEIKCRRCGTLNVLRPQEPSSERRERPLNGDPPCSRTADR